MSTETRDRCATLDLVWRNHAHGLSQIPIRMDGTKAPDCPIWKPYQTEPPSYETLRRWHANPCGWAVVAGEVSGHLECVDIDAPDLVEPFREAIEAAKPGLLAKLTQNQTPRPGLHVAYRCLGVTIPGNHVLAKTEPRPVFDKVTGEPVIVKATGKQKIAPMALIETRGEGGYFIVPPSPGACHPTGREYQHVGGPPLYEVQEITVEERDAVHRVARTFNLYLDEDEGQNGNERAEKQYTDLSVNRDAADVVAAQRRLRPGDAYNAGATWDEILSAHGWRRDKVAGGLVHWTRPDKDAGTSATTGAVSKSGNELFCCFSTNAFPFEGANASKPCTSYTKFFAYALLNHGGDFDEATRALAAAGYGQSATGARTDSASATSDQAAPAIPRRTIGHLELAPDKPRATAAKITVPVDLILDTVLVDHRKLTDSDSSRKQLTNAACQLLADDLKVHRPAVEAAVAGILVDARAYVKNSRKAPSGAQDVRAIIGAEVRKRVDLTHIDGNGRAFDRIAGRPFSRAQFVEWHTCNELIAMAASAIDATRDENGVLNRASMLSAVERELKILWGDLIGGLGSVEFADLGAASEAAHEFRAVVVKAWTKLDTFSLNKKVIIDRDRDGDSVQLMHRGSLIQLVRDAMWKAEYESAAGPAYTSDEKWQETKPGRYAWYRRTVDHRGKPGVLLAMRFEMLGQLNLHPPEGVRDQKTFRRLGIKYGVFVEGAGIPDRCDGGNVRIAILSRELTNDLLAEPNATDDETANHRPQSENFTDDATDDGGKQSSAWDPDRPWDRDHESEGRTQ
jgi:hypothetical protein